ncbi:hypothetical protein FOZ62_021296 [Perkinsus olseni]|uniref:Uncharacterized protein n=1 Tax=Perkinsus olseni TaxID=32597 RepID=A0A7J6SRX8_PEROL|nr:hypothetical protein FOZ62_021296 [Perkinsus olseni]
MFPLPPSPSPAETVPPKSPDDLPPETSRTTSWRWKKRLAEGGIVKAHSRKRVCRECQRQKDATTGHKQWKGRWWCPAAGEEWEAFRERYCPLAVLKSSVVTELLLLVPSSRRPQVCRCNEAVVIVTASEVV